MNKVILKNFGIVKSMGWFYNLIKMMGTLWILMMMLKYSTYLNEVAEELW